MHESYTRKTISPYGGTLVNLLVDDDSVAELTREARSLPGVQLNERALCDLELLATGAFSPLKTFMGKEDYTSVLQRMRLASGHLFPIPITLPVSERVSLKLDQRVALLDSRNEPLGVMTVEEIYAWDLEEAAHFAFGTTDTRHPLVAEMYRWGNRNISGRLQLIRLPRHHDFKDLRLTPIEVRSRLDELDVANVVAFQTRNPLHRAHEELAKRATAAVDGILLLHPVVGMTKPGDIDHFTRVRTYKALAAYFDPQRILLALLPLAMRLAGPREALWHALIRRNFGANHIIVGRDHASPGLDSQGRSFYPPYQAQEMVDQHSEELGVKVIPFSELVYLPEEDRYEETTRVASNTMTAAISGTTVRKEYLESGTPLPSWFTRPEIAEILTETYPPRHRQGVCIWFTGLSGAGKSTTAEILTELLQEKGRQVTVLDGDVVRTHLSRGLGFSKEDRDLNIRRIGFVAAEIVRHGGIAICAAVSPYRATRNDVRNMVGRENFVEVFVDTPLEECEKRDTKGMYERARRGEIENFTGLNDPYESPQHPEITLETIINSPEANARLVLEHLIERGNIRTGQRDPS